VAGARGAEIFADVSRAAHADERARDDGKATHEGDRALRVGGEPRERLAHLLRELARELRLEQRGARNDGDAELRRGLEHGEIAIVDALRGRAHRFVEREVDGELHGVKVVIGARYFPRGFHEHREAQVPALARWRAETVPRRASVAADLAGGAARFEQLEGRAQAPLKLRIIDSVELLLGVVQIVEIDRFDAEVCAAARELIGEEGGSEAVSAGDYVVGSTLVVDGGVTLQGPERDSRDR